MDNILDRIWTAFQRLFADLSGGNFTDIALTDLGIVAMVVAVPLFTIMVVVGNPRN
jgi:hypothetical protein